MPLDVSRSADARPVAGRLDFHVRLSLIAAAALGYLVLFSVGIYPLEWLPGVVAALALGYGSLSRPRPAFFPVGVYTTLTVLVVAGAFGLAFVRVILYLDALNFILLLLPLIKLLTARGERDYLQSYALGFAQILYGTVINSEVYFGLLLAGYLLVTMWGLMLLAHRVETSRPGRRPGLAREIEAAVFRRRLAGFLLLAWAAAVGLTFLIFLILPRPGSAFSAFSFGLQRRVSGFSGSVTLGEVGEIKLDGSVAMRVEIGGPEPARPIYWRGAVFDTFDGFVWSVGRDVPLPIRPRQPGNLYQLGPASDERRMTRQTVFNVGIETGHLFHAGPVERVRAPSRRLLLHSSGVVSLPVEARTADTYTVWTSDGGWPPADGDERERSLRLPDNLDPRLPALARSIAAGTRDERQLADTITEHLRREYGYTLQSGPEPASDPLADFLFDTRAGHCEHFATALAIMLRLNRVPARLVTGYQEGEYEEGTRYFLVRQSDAHAWVEALIDGEWRRFDPTPAAGWERHGAGLFDEVRLLADSLAFRWQRYIVFFSLRDQLDFLVAADRKYHGAFAGGARQWLGRNAADLAALAGVAGLILLIWSGRRRLAGLLPSFRKRQSSQIELSRRFASLVRRLRRTVPARRPEQTAAEYCELAGRHHPEAVRQLGDWLGLFHTLRYGGGPVRPSDLDRLDALERRIGSLLKRQRERSGDDSRS